MEQLIVVATFAICAAACVKILAASYFMATSARDKSNAIRAAETGAECFKAVFGDIAKTAEILGGSSVNINGASEAVVYYDKDWRVCDEKDAVYIMRLLSGNAVADPAQPLSGELLVGMMEGEEILSFPIAARKG